MGCRYTCRPYGEWLIEEGKGILANVEVDEEKKGRQVGYLELMRGETKPHTS